MSQVLPSHLGGHKNKTHLDEGVLNYMINTHKVKSMLDIGCGPGGMVNLAEEKGLYSYGIDGDFLVERKGKNFLIHDYTTGPSALRKNFDLCWSCEFVEHVEDQYKDNYMEDFKKGKFVVMTFSLKSGHHHVNLKPQEYWVDLFENYGFKFDSLETQKIRDMSTMGVTRKKQFVKNNGLFFYR